MNSFYNIFALISFFYAFFIFSILLWDISAFYDCMWKLWATSVNTWRLFMVKVDDHALLIFSFRALLSVTAESLKIDGDVLVQSVNSIMIITYCFLFLNQFSVDDFLTVSMYFSYWIYSYFIGCYVCKSLFIGNSVCIPSTVCHHIQ